MSLALQRNGGSELQRYVVKQQQQQQQQLLLNGGDKEKPTAAAAAAGGNASVAGRTAATAADAQQLQQYVKQLQDTFVQAAGSADAGMDAAEQEAAAADGSSSAAGQQQRQWAIEQLCSVLKQAAAPAALKQEVLQFLAVHALFRVDVGAAKKVRTVSERSAGWCILAALPIVLFGHEPHLSFAPLL